MTTDINPNGAHFGELCRTPPLSLGQTGAANHRGSALARVLELSRAGLAVLVDPGVNRPHGENATELTDDGRVLPRNRLNSSCQQGAYVVPTIVRYVQTLMRLGSASVDVNGWQVGQDTDFDDCPHTETQGRSHSTTELVLNTLPCRAPTGALLQRQLGRITPSGFCHPTSSWFSQIGCSLP